MDALYYTDAAISYQEFVTQTPIAGTSWSLRLATDTTLPDVGDVSPPYPYHEPTVSGYAAHTIVPGDWVFSSPLPGRCDITLAAVTFAFNAYTGPTQTVRFWVLTVDTPKFLLWSGVLPTPYTIPAGGGSFTIHNITLTQEQCNGVATPTVYLQDAFHGIDGTLLQAHPMDVGSGWTAVVGTFQILGNKAQPLSDTDGSIATADPGFADYKLTVGIIPEGTDSSREEFPVVIFRFVDPSNHLQVAVDCINGTISLYKQVSGTFTSLSVLPASIPSGVECIVTVYCIGTAVIVLLAGTVVIAAVVPEFATATPVGLRLGKLGTGTACQWTSLLCVPV